MNKYITLLLIFFSSTLNAQQMERPDPIDISNILSYDEFQEIKTFIINKGLTSTYCNLYNDNPYYPVDMDEVEEIEVYLDPIFKFATEKKNPDSYDNITIKFWNVPTDYPYMYTYIKEDKINKKVYLTPYYDTKKSMKDRQKRIGKYIDRILHEVRLNPSIYHHSRKTDH